VYGFFQNGGQRCYVVAVGANQGVAGGGTSRHGIDALETVDDVHIVAVPGYTDAGSYEAAIAHCEKMRNRVAILDAPLDVTNIDLLTQVGSAPAPASGATSSASGPASENGLRARESASGGATYYFPWLTVRDPLPPNQLVNVAPSGHIAGIWARSDATRGVHKAPANEAVAGALNVTYRVTQEEQAELNPSGVNVIRFFPREGIRVWGARTLAPSASEWRYVNVRRLFNMIEESIALSTNWIVFEPNSRTLWKSIRRDVTAFLTRVWRDGGLMGRTAEEAFFVKCDEETNPPEVVDAGQVVTIIGAAPVKPAEFIVFEISQAAQGAQLETAQAGG
jgi:phage tail sheath protein FI